MGVPHRQEVDGCVRWTLRDQRPLRTVATLVLVWILLTPVGPGVLALGTGEFIVACDGPHLQCRLEEGYLFGLVPLETGLTGLREARLVDVGDSGATLIEFSTLTGAPRASHWMSSLAREDQRSLVRQVNVALRSGGAFTVRQSMHSPLALFGALMAVLWLLVTWGLVRLPLVWLWPQAVWLERGERQLVIRLAGGALRRQRVAAGELREVLTTRNPGGPFGAFIAREVKAPTDPDDERRPPPLNVCLVLSGERRLVLRNEYQWPDEEVRTFAADLGVTVGVGVRDEVP